MKCYRHVFHLFSSGIFLLNVFATWIITQMTKLKCCIYILWYLFTFYEKKWNCPKTNEWWRHIPGSFTSLILYCSWHVLEKAVNTLQLVQFTFVGAKFQWRTSYMIDMKTHDGTGHTTQTSSPPAQCLSHLLTSPPFSYIFKNTCNRERDNKDLSKADIPCMSNEGQKYQNPALHNQ